jgi:predicted ATPase
MKIEQLTLENFKCFKSEKIFDFSRLTILTGANSSGKSSVIQAILMALQSEGFPKLLSVNGDYINLGDFENISNNHEIDKVIKINIVINSFKFITSWFYDLQSLSPKEIKVKDLRSKVNYIFQISDKQLNNKVRIDIQNIPNRVYDEKDIVPTQTFFVNTLEQKEVKVSYKDNCLTIDNIDLTSIIPFQNNVQSFFKLSERGDLVEHFKYIDNNFFVNNNTLLSLNYVSAFRQSPRRTYYEQNNANYKVGTEGEEYIDQIVEWDKRSNGKIKQLIETMKSLDLFEDLKINRLGGGRFEVLIKPIKSNGFSALSDVGSGVSAFMPIVVADLQLPYESTLFLQEPETHLHPSIQAKFADYIIHQINTTNKNYVIETHSEYILNRIRLAIVKGELEQEKLSAYFLENNPNDAEVYKVEFTKTGGIRKAPKSFFETYLMDIMEITLNAVAE